MPVEKQNPTPSDGESGAALAQRYGVPFVDLANFKIDSEVLQMFPEQFMRSKQVIPLFRAGNTLAAAFVDPGDIFNVDEVRRMTGMEVEPMVCRDIELQEALNQYYSSSQSADLPD